MQCEFCGGKGVVTAPAGILQQCPVCNGTGQSMKNGYWFVIPDNTALLLNEQRDNVILNVSDADFVLMYLTGFGAGKFLFKLWDGTRQLPFMSDFVHSDNAFGSAQNPFPLLVPYRFNKGGLIRLDYKDLSGAGNQLRIALHGVRITG